MAKQRGHKMFFLGMGTETEPNLDVFEKIRMVRSINNRQAALDKSIRSEWADVVREIDPDVIHASDIIAAKFSSETGFPMVYDDREYWSMQRIQYETWPFWKRIAIRPFTEAIPIWEREIISRYVTITVSEGIASEHRRISSNVFVLGNYGLLIEFEGLPVNPKREGVVFVGGDMSRKTFAKHRDLTGITEHLTFDALSGFPRNELYRRLSKYRFGLLPFRPSPYHKYSNASKTFDYLNCGLQVIMTQMLYEAHGNLPYTYPFQDYDDLPRVIETTEYVDPADIIEYSHKNLVWENQSDKLHQVYDLCLELHKQ
ncbi:MAG: hypothetical protein ACW96M_01005 [Candidatus Thorarchaeota archaeon]